LLFLKNVAHIEVLHWLADSLHMNTMYVCFQEAQQSLLFLKNVAHIEVLHWLADSPEPQSLWTCNINNPSKLLAEARAMVPAAVAQVSGVCVWGGRGSR